MATQLNPVYTLTGRVTNGQGEPLEGLTVRAYDQVPKTPENPPGTDAVRRDMHDRELPDLCEAQDCRGDLRHETAVRSVRRQENRKGEYGLHYLASL